MKKIKKPLKNGCLYVVFFLDAGRCAPAKSNNQPVPRQPTTVSTCPDNWFVAKQIRRVCRVNTPCLVSKHAVFAWRKTCDGEPSAGIRDAVMAWDAPAHSAALPPCCPCGPTV